MPHWLSVVFIGAGLCGLVWRWKKPLGLRVLCMAALTGLTVLSGLSVPEARYLLFLTGTLWLSAQFLSLRQMPKGAVIPFLLGGVLLFGVFPVVGLFRLVVLETYPRWSGEWRELVFCCAATLPMGVCAAVSFVRLQKNKRGHTGRKEG